MPPTDPQISLHYVLQVFQADLLYLFLASAITTVGLLAAAFSFLRRRFDPLLLWFVLFALFYGVRLWLSHQLLALPGQDTPSVDRTTAIITFLIPIPAFFFVRQLSLVTRVIRPLIWIITPFAILLTLTCLVIGPRPAFYQINNLVVTVALVLLVIALLRERLPYPDLDLVRRGLFVFTAAALYENIASFFGPVSNIETFSFIVLLICLGIVAGRRTSRRSSSSPPSRKSSRSPSASSSPSFLRRSPPPPASASPRATSP